MKKPLKLNKNLSFKILNNILILVLSFSSCKMDNKSDIIDYSNKSNPIEHKFYDFNFKVKIYRNPVGVSKEIMYHHDSQNEKNNKLKVTYFNYYDENQVQLKEPIKKEFYVRKERMDTLFNIIVKEITPSFSVNYSNEKIPPPPTFSNEWEYGTIELDLLFRGDKYLITTRSTDVFYELLKLL